MGEGTNLVAVAPGAISIEGEGDDVSCFAIDLTTVAQAGDVPGALLRGG